MAKSVLAFTIYHFNEYPKELRAKFSLPCSPYLILKRPNDNYVKKAIEYLKSLNVIMYRDNTSNGSGIFLIEGLEIPQSVAKELNNKSDLSDIIGNLRFNNAAQCYKSSCIAQVDSAGRITPRRVMARTESEQIGRLRRINQKGDDIHWIYWNTPVNVKHINHAVVNTEKT